VHPDHLSLARAPGSKLWGIPPDAFTAEFSTASADANPSCSRTILRIVASPKPLPSTRVSKTRFEAALECHFVHAAPGVTDGNAHIAAGCDIAMSDDPRGFVAHSFTLLPRPSYLIPAVNWDE